MKLLIVDDSEKVRQMIRDVVCDLAETVYECSDGSQALDSYSDHRPDWVLMDIKMAEVDGFTATRQIKAAFPTAKVMIVTAYDDAERFNTPQGRSASSCWPPPRIAFWLVLWKLLRPLLSLLVLALLQRSCANELSHSNPIINHAGASYSHSCAGTCKRRTSMQRHLILYLLAFSLLLGVSAKALAQGGSFTSIDFPGARLTAANSINNAGDIVGFYNLDASLVGHGYLLSGSQFTPIDYPGATSTNALGNNNVGDIVGSYTDSTGVGHGYLLSGGKFTTIDFPGAVFTSAAGINDAGDIVGTYQDGGGASHGFLLSGGEFTSIDFPGAGQTFASGINTDRTIVGTYHDSASISHGFWLSGGEFTPLPNFPGVEQTTATRINAAGNIVGGYIDSTGFHGFLLSGGDLTSFDFPGVLFTIANGINDAGGIVGTYQDGTSLLHGFLLETGPTPLERLDCKREPSLRSIEGSTPTSITFVNNTAGTVTVYWLDYSGSRVPYYALPAGDSYVQGTFLTHPWVVTDSSGQCLGIYLPVSRPGVAVIR